MGNTSQKSAYWVTKGVALATLLLVAWFAFAEATHFHPVKPSGSNERCSFCAVAHANAAVVPVASVASVVPELAPTQVLSAENCTPKSSLHGSDLSIRPPPLV